ncbi:MAG: type VI secretion system contractile sheath large subunit [Motiliproteus sp.]
MYTPDWQQAFNSLDPQAEDFLPRALTLLAKWDPSLLKSPAVLKAALSRLITELDRQLSEQLSTIMHQPAFRELEAGWRNLKSLVELPVGYQRIQIKLMDIHWQELAQDLNGSSSLRRSVLYNHIGNRELNTLGGQPYGMVVINHGVTMEMGLDDDYDDLYTLELLGQLGALCLCSFVLAPSLTFFGETGADWLSDIRRIEKILEGPDYASWQRLRAQPSARFLGLAMPQVQLRQDYQNHRIGFIFNESAAERPGLWGSAAFAFASIAIREFNRIHWFGFMKSRWQDSYQGAVVNLPPQAASDSYLKRPVPDVVLFGNLARRYAALGFIPLSQSNLTDKFYFYGNNSLWKPGPSDADQVVCQLQTTLMICLVAHYLKVQIRAMIGSFHTAAECEQHLSRWLDDYCSNVDEADDKILAKYPLKKGQVRVKELDDGHGRYVCEILIQPHYQFDYFCGDVLLSTDMDDPRSAGGAH